MLKFLPYILLISTFFFHSTLFSQIEETSGYVFIEVANDYVKDLRKKGQNVEEIITFDLQEEIIKNTEAWTVEETRGLRDFLLENIGQEQTIRVIINDFSGFDFQAVSYSDFTKMAELFIEHIGADGLSVRLLKMLESMENMMPELKNDIEDIERLMLFIKDYVEDEDTAIEIIINNDLSFIELDNLRSVLISLEEQGFEKIGIIEVMKVNLSGLNLYSSDFSEKIGLLLEHEFPKADILDVLKTGGLDELRLEELRGMLEHLESSGFERTTIINVLAKSLHRLNGETFHADFFDLKEVVSFLEGYIGKEGVNKIASDNFMFFYNIDFVELKNIVEALEGHTERELLIRFLYSLSVYDRYGLSPNHTLVTHLRSIFDAGTQRQAQFKQESDGICLIALTNLSTFYNLPIQNSFYFNLTFFNLRNFRDNLESK